MIVGLNYPWSTARYRSEGLWHKIESYGSDIGKTDILPTAVNRYGTHPLLVGVTQLT